MTNPERDLTDEELRAAAALRFADPDPGLIESWRSDGERRLAEIEATGREIPSEAGARVAPK